jgi:hypothetical protein
MKRFLVVCMAIAAAVPGAEVAQAQGGGDCIWVNGEFVVTHAGEQVTLTYSHGIGEGPADSSGDTCNRDVPPGPDAPLQIDVEVVGAGDPDGSFSSETPDFSCDLPNEAGSSCSVTFGGQLGSANVSAWIDLDADDTTIELDRDEGWNEGREPGALPEPDGTELSVVSWEHIEPNCNDGVDNDGDGHTDYPADPQCDSNADDEEPECSDGADKDGDRLTDYPDDPDCASAEDDSESFQDPHRDCPSRGPSANVISATEGSDVIKGTSDRDFICGWGGNDVIEGRGGNDVIYGNEGTDILRGNGGSDELRGGRDADRLRGGDGFDELYGGRGIDRCWGERERTCE